MYYSLAWIVITFLCLALAAYYDWKQRWIPDKIWLIQILSSLIVLAFWYIQSPPFFDIVLVLINIVLGFMISILILFTGAMAGGDLKAFFSVSVSYPLLAQLWPVLLPLPDTFPSLFSILLNFFFLYIILALGFFAFNFSRMLKGEHLFDGISGSLSQQLKLMFEGVVVDTENIESRQFYNPGEILEDHKWKLYTPDFNGMMTDEEFEEMERKEREEMIKSIRQSGKSRIWIRPQIPGLIFIFLSFSMTISVGTILGSIFTLITS